MLSFDCQQGFIVVLVDTFRRLHFGNFAGLFSKTIYSIAGFMPVILALTGGYLWLSRRNKRAKKRVSRALS
nr:PepSY-associated TM helix domain-containing protein [Pseudoalteromonas sp. MMG022]